MYIYRYVYRLFARRDTAQDVQRSFGSLSSSNIYLYIYTRCIYIDIYIGCAIDVIPYRTYNSPAVSGVVVPL